MALESKTVKALGNPVQDLKVELTSKENEGNMIGAKDGNTSDATSCISSGDASSSIKEREVDQEALVAEQSAVNGVYGYYYPGFDGSMGDWEGNGYFVWTDGSGIQYSTNQSENGSLVYYFPGFQAGYPYSPVSPGSVVGVDGQYFTQQLYHTSPILHQPPVSTGFFPQSIVYGPELVPAYVWDSASTCVDGLHGNGYCRDSPEPYPKPYFSSQNHAITTSKATVPSRSSVLGNKAAANEMDLSQDAAMKNHAFKPMTKVNNELSKSFHPTNKVHSNGSPGKSILQYPSMAGNGKSSGRTWVGIERHKAASQPHGIGDILNEQNRGPRTLGGHGAWVSSYAATAGSDANNNSNCILVASIEKEDYNLSDFPTNYDHALFFVIKSYSEDNIHKSIKYNVWASTPNGNKRLDHAFQGAQEKTEEKGCKCPVFLFFSVNASGQFCGVSEMIGPVDFNRNMDFWQQDKWNGYFPVKWHIIKDIPNPHFRHIILENNENKPVTNSRDTQEVKNIQGSEMLNIFKNYSAKTSMFENFGFYESRQKTMQDKRIKPVITKLENLTFRSEAAAKCTKPADQKTISSSPQLLEEAGAENKEEFQSDLVQQ